MLSSRVIPVLSLKANGLIKTINFNNPVYLGDCLNVVRIFNEKEVDELVILDIYATIENREPNYNKIKEIATECFMPLAYGGGIKTVDQIKKIFDLGIEKVIINSSSSDLELLNKCVEIFGSQSIVVSVDVRKNFFGKYEIFFNSGKIKYKTNLEEHIFSIINAGAGELIIQSIDNDGLMKGYDLKLIKKVSQKVNVPIIALGGAGKLMDFRLAIDSGASSVGAGSYFVFKGKHKAVLISYPSQEELVNLFK
jgi:cyclase